MSGPLRAEEFPENVRLALANEKLRRHLSGIMPALHQRGQHALLDAWRPEFEAMRARAEQIRDEVIADLDGMVRRFTEETVRRGGIVFRAGDAAEANAYVIELARRHGVRTAVKAKSMATEEIRLNEAMAAAGVEPIETDLGQLINQLAGDEPFHMIGPAMHHTRGDVASLFAAKLGVERTEQLDALAKIARRHLRQQFCDAGMGISGVNFGVAETGTIVLCENEGNIGLSTTAPRLHVAVMGIERILPRLADVALFVRLLARAGGGIPIFRYVSMLTGRRPGGPELHVVLLDNGRAAMRDDPVLRPALRCIRCGACQGACPVYTAVGGHAYGSIYQGPIGAIVSNQLYGFGEASHLVKASTLCGACADVCPVKIPIPELLLELRERAAAREEPGATRLGMKLWSLAARHPWLYRALTSLARRAQRWIGRSRLWRWLPLVGAWQGARELPPAPARGFLERKRKEKEQRP
jgi:L-lactate dehydrogenase complex protein LldF